MSNESTLQLLNYHDLSKVLKRSESQLRVDVMYKKIPFIKVGRSVRFDMRQIQAWLDAQAVPARPADGK